MRISDWSSDVCSSDLLEHRIAAPIARVHRQVACRFGDQRGERIDMRGGEIADMDIVAHAGAVGGGEISAEHRDMAALAGRRHDRDLDQVRRTGGRARMSVVEGKSLSVSLVSGGRLRLKKKKRTSRRVK